MKYFDFQGKTISALGFGCMRFAKMANGEIDIEKTTEQISYAVKNGLNYIDTAYVYEGSEIAVGKVLKQTNLREQVFLTTKLPRWRVEKHEDFYTLFGEQLENLQTTWFDFYIIHNLNAFDDWRELKKLGILQFISDIKKSGQIKHIGFSFHGGCDDFKKILDDFAWEFTQLQINYLDQDFQAGLEGLRYAKEKNIPVVIMEPIRGGKLVTGLPNEVKDLFSQLNKQTNQNLSFAQWALKWVFNLDGILTVLSGMNEMMQVEENMSIASEFSALTAQEKETFEKVHDILKRKTKIRCTECNYCSGCPQGVDIPAVFGFYNSKHLLEDVDAEKSYHKFLEGADATKCVGCGDCLPKCPQAIDVVQWMSVISEEFK